MLTVQAQQQQAYPLQAAGPGRSPALALLLRDLFQRAFTARPAVETSNGGPDRQDKLPSWSSQKPPRVILSHGCQATVPTRQVAALRIESAQTA